MNSPLSRVAQELRAAGLALLAFAPAVLAAAEPARVLFIAGKGSHGFFRHEYNAGLILLADRLNRSGLPIAAEVFHDRTGRDWPAPAQLAGAAAVILFSDGRDAHPVRGRQAEVDTLQARGVGLGWIHWSVIPPADESPENFLRWFGGYFEVGKSSVPIWLARFDALPMHPVTRGVRPFAIEDEWYMNLTYRPGLAGITPILSARPPPGLIPEKGPENLVTESSREAVRRGEIQHVMWVAEAPGGPRSFGFTGGHFHDNWQDDDFRRVVLNAIAWIARVEVPPGGVASDTPSDDELLRHQDFPVDPRRFRKNRYQEARP